MPELTRHLEIMSLSPSLTAYARSLQTDANAAVRLVHDAVAHAFAARARAGAG